VTGGGAARPISRFALEAHPGPYEKWPSRSRLLDAGAPTRRRIPGYTLLHQYELPDGYLLVTDYDCPFEEMTVFTLLGPDLRTLSCRRIGAPYNSFLLTGLEWNGEREFVAAFGSDCRFRFTVRPRGIPLLRPRLAVRRLAEPS